MTENLYIPVLNGEAFEPFRYEEFGVLDDEVTCALIFIDLYIKRQGGEDLTGDEAAFFDAAFDYFQWVKDHRQKMNDVIKRLWKLKKANDEPEAKDDE